MKKLTVLFIFLLFLCAFAQDEVVQGSIKYNEATAKIEAFKNVEKKIDMHKFKDYFTDKNRKQNLELMKNDIFQIETRSLFPFYVKDAIIAYAIVYSSDSRYTFYYNYIGKLMKIEILEDDISKKRTFGYSRFGNLISVSFEAGDNEQFVYNEKGKLIAHWLDDTLVSENNKDTRFFKITRSK